MVVETTVMVVKGVSGASHCNTDDGQSTVHDRVALRKLERAVWQQQQYLHFHGGSHHLSNPTMTLEPTRDSEEALPIGV